MENRKTDKIKKEIIQKAMREYGRIRPCGYCRELEESFTRQGKSICFWFNTDDNQTHMLKVPATGDILSRAA